MALAGLTRWALIAALVASLLGGLYLLGRSHGKATERAAWTERLVIAERAARQTEHDLAGIAAKSAARIAEKERLLDERAREQDANWRATLAALPACRVPARVGVRLNAAAGVSAPATVARPPDPGPDGADLDPVVDLAETLDACRRNNEAGRTNAGRLTEARTWYEAVRNRVNEGATQ